MKAITLTQPWATLVAIGAKKIETRSWSTSYRGPLAIHAGKGPGSLGWMQMQHLCCNVEPFNSTLGPMLQDRHPAQVLPLGAIVAVCDLVDCVPSEKIMQAFGAYGPEDESGGRALWTLTDQELAFGDYTPGRYAWLLADVRALPEPVPAKGALGLWEYDGEL